MALGVPAPPGHPPHHPLRARTHAQVHCDKYPLLCERFGITGSTGVEPGLPHIIWFKGGKEEGGYDGERTVEGFVKWVLAKQDTNVL